MAEVAGKLDARVLDAGEEVFQRPRLLERREFCARPPALAAL